MKKNQMFFVLIAALGSAALLRPMEIGKYDGGEYLSDALRVRSGGVFNRDVVNQVKWFDGDISIAELRKAFPVFKQIVNNHPLIYLDSASTAQMPQAVIDAIIAYYETYKSNAGRGLYDFAERTTQAFEDTREKVAYFIGAKKQEIVFTSGATASINLVASIWAKHHIEKGDEIVISEIEHNANFIPWQQLAKQKGAALKIVPVSADGTVDIEAFRSSLSKKTKLVAISHQSNILGAANDIVAIVKAAHAVGAKVLVDAAQSIAHQRINVKQLQCDFLAFSGHKLFGPTGVGVLFIKDGLGDECVLQNFGGGMVYSVTPEHTEFKCVPYCLEPGTQPIAQVIGLGAAIDFVMKNINFEQAQEHETQLVRKLAQELASIPEITIISPIPEAGKHNNMVTFTSSSLHSYDVAEYLNEYGIAVRSGFHCVQPYHDKLGGKSSVRVSFTVYNTVEEVDFLVECLKKLFLAA